MRTFLPLRRLTGLIDSNISKTLSRVLLTCWTLTKLEVRSSVPKIFEILQHKVSPRFHIGLMDYRYYNWNINMPIKFYKKHVIYRVGKKLARRTKFYSKSIEGILEESACWESFCPKLFPKVSIFHNTSSTCCWVEKIDKFSLSISKNLELL